jgi:hypothetical protein
MVRQHQTRNLEIPGSLVALAPRNDENYSATPPHSRDAIRPSFANPFAQERAQGMPGTSMRPQPCVRTKKAHKLKSPQVHRKHPAFPTRWFYGFLRALSGEPGFFATIACKIMTSQA